MQQGKERLVIYYTPKLKYMYIDYPYKYPATIASRIASASRREDDRLESWPVVS